VAEAGSSKLGGDPGLHNKPLGCGASEVYASGPASEEEEAWYLMEEGVQLHDAVTLCLGESPQYKVNVRLVGVQSWSGHF
jgi:hypothetical protein